MNCASRFIHRPLIQGSAVTLFFLLILSALPSSAQTPECSGLTKLHLLGSEPVQVNPGARCNMHLLIVYQGESFDIYNPPPPNYCLFVRRVGRTDTIGPLCRYDKGARLPPDIEYLWSDGKRTLWVDVTLTPKKRR